MSDFEALLQQQINEATLDSSGVFTMAREEAIRKLAAFQLQVPAWWILKCVQSAVGSGAVRLSIRCSLTDVQIAFEPAEAWTMELLEREIWNPEPTSLAGIDHLKRALWSVGLHEGRPFQIELKGQKRSLLCLSGTPRQHELRRPSERTCITVSHRRWEKGFSLMGALDAAGANQALANTLSARAHVCPIPLVVDGKRLDSLFASTTHGYTSTTYPFLVANVHTAAPNLPCPNSMYQSLERPPLSGPMQVPLNQVRFNPRLRGAVLLLAFGARAAAAFAESTPRPVEFPSLVHWVRDGVIIDTTRLPLAERCVAAAVFVSADRLQTDVSGFGLTDTAAREQRLGAACLNLAPEIELAQVDLHTGAQKLSRDAQGGALGLLAVGAIMSFAWIPVGLGLLAVGGGALYLAGRGESHLAYKVQAGLQELKKEWKSLTSA